MKNMIYLSWAVVLAVVVVICFQKTDSLSVLLFGEQLVLMKKLLRDRYY